MDRADKIMIIAEHYGFDTQSRQCVEEMAELTVALNKLWRNLKSGREIGEMVLDNLKEELTDVHIMLFQISYLTGQSMEIMMDEKLDRQLKRIEEDKNGKSD